MPADIGFVMTNFSAEERIAELELENQKLKTDLTLLRSELDTVFNNCVMGVALVDGNRNVLRSNSKFLNMLGYDSPDAVVGKDTLNLHYSPEAFHDFGKYYETILKNRGTVQVTARLKKCDGTDIWLDLVGRALDQGENPDLSKGVIWMGYDLTDIRSLYTQLNEAKDDLESYFENSMVGVLVLRGGRKIHRLNKRMADLLGEEPPEFHAGRLVSDYYPSLKAYEEFGRKYYNNLINKSQMQVELEIKKLDGTLFNAVASGKALDTATPPDLNKGVIWLIDDISKQKEAEAKLEVMATTDYLTGVSNRRYFIELAERELSIHKRHSRALSVLLLDIDFFKSVNDRFGHAAGDRALKFFAETSSQQLRSADIMGRFGGEEFCIVLPDTGLEQASQVAERIRESVLTQSSEAPEMPQITVSIGVAEADNSRSLEESIQMADKAVYMAKEAGRNCVYVYDSPKR